jgi:threonine/homoserine/homoserine lactone efflux protein
VFAFDRVRHFFHRPAARRTLETISGIALVGLALRVLL